MADSTVKRSEDFNEWYNQIVESADLCDKRYPVKGMNIWRPYGLKAMKNIDALIHKEMERTSHEEVMFPLLVPETLFQKETDHIKGFGATALLAAICVLAAILKVGKKKH